MASWTACLGGGEFFISGAIDRWDRSVGIYPGPCAYRGDGVVPVGTRGGIQRVFLISRRPPPRTYRASVEACGRGGRMAQAVALRQQAGTQALREEAQRGGGMRRPPRWWPTATKAPGAVSRTAQRSFALGCMSEPSARTRPLSLCSRNSKEVIRLELFLALGLALRAFFDIFSRRRPLVGRLPYLYSRACRYSCPPGVGSCPCVAPLVRRACG